jgi:leucyl aminopeptidase
MKNNISQVFDVPKIKQFELYVDRLFSNPDKKSNGIIYFIKYNNLNKSILPKNILSFYNSHKEKHEDGKIIYLPKLKANTERCIVLYGKNKYKNIDRRLGALVSNKINNGRWKLFNSFVSKQLFDFTLGWGLDQYKFNSHEICKYLELSKNINKRILSSTLSALFYGKELINIPSSDMGPDELEQSFIDFTNYHNGKLNIINDATIKSKFPLIYAVGKSSIQKPRLLEFNWGKTSDPLIILVGKGVCFDTGGLDLKPSQYMRNMKKDMGGAASVLSLAHIIIKSQLKVNLKVLIPAVDNDIGPNAMRPGDVYNSRLGITVEIGNTDAEGRLILADTLSYADSFKPKLLIDFATLTGAARVALGPDVPAYFTHSEPLGELLNKISIREFDHLWRLPMYLPYESWLSSEVADTNNIAQGGFAGSIVAALFLNKFVRPTTNWIHIDTYAWSDSNKPGHSKGGDILGVRAAHKLIKEYINNL